METRIVELCIMCDHEVIIHSLIYTDAPDDVISNICSDIERDNIVERNERLKSVRTILRVRGYVCDVVDNIPRFGFFY